MDKMEKCCANCKYFLSYEDMFEDELELEDSGICTCSKSKLYNEHISSNEYCSEFKMDTE